MLTFNSTIPFLYLMFGAFFIFIMRNNCYLEDKEEEDKEEDKEKDKDKEEDKKEVKVIKYEDKYWDKYERMLNKEKLEENKTKENEISKNNILFENTPNGNVLMFYDSKRASFIYYADTAIPYRYLETVARKYVTTYFCLHLYVDMKKEIEDAEQKIIDRKKLEEEKLEERKLEEKKLEEEGKDKDKKNVFAKLKNYNTGSNTVVKGSKLAETNPNRSSSSTMTNSKKEYVLKENANRFSYEGKIVNYKLKNQNENKLHLVLQILRK